MARLHALRKAGGIGLRYWYSEGYTGVRRGRVAACRYERTIGKETIEWPVTEIVVSSMKKLGKVEKSESAGTEPQSVSEFSEQITDDDVPI